MKVVLDVDTGVDDAQAIMLALANKDVDVVGITCVSGNAGVDQVCVNTLRVLRLCGRPDVPVYRGAERPLAGREYNIPTHVHGADGLGGVTEADVAVTGLTDTAAYPQNIQEEPAAVALSRLSKAHAGELTLVALAPLTNLALALRLDPGLGARLHGCVIMGGNTRGISEFNFAADPEGARVVLQELGCPLTVVPLDATATAGMSWEEFDRLASIDTVKAKFNSAIQKVYVDRKRNQLQQPTYFACDPCAVAVVLRPDVIDDVIDVYCSVETSGHVTRGFLVIDWNGKTGNPPNVKLVLRMKSDVITHLLEDMVRC